MAEGPVDSAYVRYLIDGVQPGLQPWLVVAVVGMHMARKRRTAGAALVLQCSIASERQ